MIGKHEGGHAEQKPADAGGGGDEKDPGNPASIAPDQLAAEGVIVRIGKVVVSAKYGVDVFDDAGPQERAPKEDARSLSSIYLATLDQYEKGENEKNEIILPGFNSHETPSFIAAIRTFSRIDNQFDFGSFLEIHGIIEIPTITYYQKPRQCNYYLILLVFL